MRTIERNHRLVAIEMWDASTRLSELLVAAEAEVKRTLREEQEDDADK
jgi:hypothetical protein